jgi:phosphoserine phosphatase
MLLAGWNCWKPTVKEAVLFGLGLDGVLYLLGYHDRHIDMMEH